MHVWVANVHSRIYGDMRNHYALQALTQLIRVKFTSSTEWWERQTTCLLERFAWCLPLTTSERNLTRWLGYVLYRTMDRVTLDGGPNKWMRGCISGCFRLKLSVLVHVAVSEVANILRDRRFLWLFKLDTNGHLWKKKKRKRKKKGTTCNSRQ
jgi:hypothetical protein